LSLRAAHLFDHFEIKDMGMAKAPLPVVWFVNDQGKLLGLTYVPEQAVGAWHQHDTDGLFESVAVVAEGADDVVYCVIKRTINGASKRYIERMGTRIFASQRDSFFVDCGATYNGTNTNTGQNVTISGGTNYTRGESVTITANYNLFQAPPSVDDKDDAIVLVDGTTTYRCVITTTSSQTVATVKLDKDLKIIDVSYKPLIPAKIGYALFFITRWFSKEDNVVMSGGLEDNKNWIWEIPKSKIFNCFN